MKLKLSMVCLILSIVIGNDYSTNASQSFAQSEDSKPAAGGSSTGQAASSGYVRNNYKTLPAAEKFRSVIVHLDRWKYTDIQKECIDHLSKDGYAAVQISPVTRHPLPDNQYPGLERHSVTSYEIDNESGTEDQLKSMIKDCNDVNVRVLIDVVLNNMMKESDTLPTEKDEVKTRTMAKQYGPDNEPAMFFDKHFHTEPTLEVNDYIRDTHKCRVGMLGGRHDLKQVVDGVPNVHMVGFLYKLIAMGAAGFRVLNADHMESEDLVKIYDTLPDVTFEKTPTRPFIYSDVYAPVADEGWEIKDKDYIQYTRVTDYKFANEISRSFQHHQNFLSVFKEFAKEKKIVAGEARETEWSLRASEDSVVFLNTPITNMFGNRALTPVPTTMYRFINPAEDDKAAKLGLGFMLTLGHGIPLITTAHTDKQHEKSPGPVSESFHRQEKTKQVMSWRNYILKTYDGKFPAIDEWNFKSQSYQGGYCVGTHGFVIFNNQPKEEELKMTFQTCFTKSGFYCDIYSGGVKNAAGANGNEICAGKFIFVDSSKKADATMPKSDGLQLYNTEVVSYRD